MPVITIERAIDMFDLLVELRAKNRVKKSVFLR
jgi:hypothetical protein